MRAFYSKSFVIIVKHMLITVAILARGTSWAVAATQAFYHHSLSGFVWVCDFASASKPTLLVNVHAPQLSW